MVGAEEGGFAAADVVVGRVGFAWGGVGLEDFRETAAERATQFKAAASEKATAFKAAATDKASQLKDTANEQWQDTRVKAKELHVTAEDYIRQNPTKCVLSALGAGFLIGLIVRR